MSPRPGAGAPVASPAGARRGSRRHDCRPARRARRSARRHAAREISRSRGIVQHAGDLGEHAVGGELAELGVELGQTVDVEHEQSEWLAPSSRAGDLALQERVEGGSVVERRQRIALRHRVRLTQLERGLECGLVTLSTSSSDVMSSSLKRRFGVRVRTASIPGSFGESSSGTARPERIGSLRDGASSLPRTRPGSPARRDSRARRGRRPGPLPSARDRRSRGSARSAVPTTATPRPQMSVRARAPAPA